ncbi:MAG: carboxypeptidase-like regulatory domain-containing protein, partial [Candidatus Acidiferrales bacterium]
MAVLLFAAMAAAASAQVPTSTLNGLVTDPKDAVVAGAHVAVVSSAQGVTRETTTNADGLYGFSNLPSGSYDLRIEA